MSAGPESAAALWRVRRLGHAYFALQALAGAAWWVGVFTIPVVRESTLGALPPVVIAALDVPLFVIGSALAAVGVRWAVWIATIWTALVALAMAIYATVTTLAGLGAVSMIAAAAGSVLAAVIVLVGRIPGEQLTRGPFTFVVAPVAAARTHVWRSVRQLVVFWCVFLVVLPAVVASLEARWQLRIDSTVALQVSGGALFVAASALAVWSMRSLAVIGEGTPLPSAQPRSLAIAGPYRWIRNPMAVASILQVVGLGLLIGSWMIVAGAVAAGFVWNWVLRPVEEADLLDRFGEDYAAYRDRVRCWVPGRGVPPGGAPEIQTPEIQTKG